MPRLRIFEDDFFFKFFFISFNFNYFLDLFLRIDITCLFSFVMTTDGTSSWNNRSATNNVDTYYVKPVKLPNCWMVMSSGL